MRPSKTQIWAVCLSRTSALIVFALTSPIQRHMKWRSTHSGLPARRSCSALPQVGMQPGQSGSRYPTFWVNRSGQPVEELGVHPDGIGSSMSDLANFVLGAVGSRAPWVQRSYSGAATDGYGACHTFVGGEP